MGNEIQGCNTRTTMSSEKTGESKDYKGNVGRSGIGGGYSKDGGSTKTTWSHEKIDCGQPGCRDSGAYDGRHDK
jgi:hypothetical protein